MKIISFAVSVLLVSTSMIQCGAMATGLKEVDQPDEIRAPKIPAYPIGVRRGVRRGARRNQETDSRSTTFEKCGKGGKGGKGGSSDQEGRAMQECNCGKGYSSCTEFADPFDDSNEGLNLYDPTSSPSTAPSDLPSSVPTAESGADRNGDSGSNESRDVQIDYEPFNPSNDAEQDADAESTVNGGFIQIEETAGEFPGND